MVIRICIISTSVFRVPLENYGGLEHIAWQQAKGLAEKGHEVALVAPEGSTCPGVTIIPTGPEGTWDEQSTYSKYWQYLPNFQVIVDHTWHKWSLNLKAEGKLTAPVLCWMHAPVNTMMQSLPPVEKPCFVCISNDQASHFEALFGMKPKVCWNGTDGSFYHPMKIKRRNRFLFLARFSGIKGPLLAQEACLQTGSGLDMIGDTSITNEPELLARCQANADGKKIKIIGGQPRGACVWWFSQALAMLHLNRDFREPFGLAPVESMLCENPVIAWKHGACKETIHPDCGWLVSSMPEAVKIVKHVAEFGISDTMRARCREWALQFSVERMVNTVESLCYEALDGGW